MSEIKIRDLYTGKPDAKDEINFEGLEEFIKTFVVADHFQLDSLYYMEIIALLQDLKGLEKPLSYFIWTTS